MKRERIRIRNNEPSGPAMRHIDSLLGTPPLFKGEDRKSYQSLRDRVWDFVKPADIIEEFWTHDVVDLMWETARLRRLKAELMSASAYKGLREVLQPITGLFEINELVEGWAAGDQTIAKKVDGLLARAEIDNEAIMAHTLLVQIDPVERIERMIAGTESRLSAVLREIDRHRESVAVRLRQAVTAIEDGRSEEGPNHINGGAP